MPSDYQRFVNGQLREAAWGNGHHLLSPRYPFGGYKQSGVGRELGEHGYLESTQVKHVHADAGGWRVR